MGIKDTKDAKLLYHLTRLDNLDTILEHGLLSRKAVRNMKIGFSDIANKDIISKRTELGLDDYIPFHFHPYSSFDVAVKTTYLDEEFVYICITRQIAKDYNFKVLPKHPLSIDECMLLEYDEGIATIDWDIMHTIGTDDDYAKNVKMAECLTDLIIPAEAFQSICVRNDDIKKIVEEKLKSYNIISKPPYVDVRQLF